MITRELLRTVLTDQRAWFLKKDTGIKREVLDRIQKKIILPHIHFITGIRRCGKSTLLRQIAAEFYRDTDFYYINFEDERLLRFEAEAFNLVYETLLELYGRKNTFIIDEIQHVRDFDAFVRRFYDNGFKFFITGSNAGILGKEISERLTGRYLSTRLSPFSFREYVSLKEGTSRIFNPDLTEDRARLTGLFEHYLVHGGMPEYALYQDPEILMHTYNDIVVKDIGMRKNIDHPVLARELYLTVLSNFARKFSYNGLQKLTSIGSVNTIKQYLGYLEETFLVRFIHKFDYSVMKQYANDKKAYVSDNGIINAVSLKAGADKGWMLENLVAGSMSVESNLHYFSGKRECDFVLSEERNVKQVIQVCWELSRENDSRESGGVIEAMDYFHLDKGLILTYGQEEVRTLGNKTIDIKPVWKWLLRGHNKL